MQRMRRWGTKRSVDVAPVGHQGASQSAEATPNLPDAVRGNPGSWYGIVGGAIGTRTTRSWSSLPDICGDPHVQRRWLPAILLQDPTKDWLEWINQTKHTCNVILFFFFFWNFVSIYCTGWVTSISSLKATILDFPVPVWWHIMATCPIGYLNSCNIGIAFEILLVSCLEVDIIKYSVWGLLRPQPSLTLVFVLCCHLVE